MTKRYCRKCNSDTKDNEVQYCCYCGVKFESIFKEELLEKQSLNELESLHNKLVNNYPGN